MLLGTTLGALTAFTAYAMIAGYEGEVATCHTMYRGHLFDITLNINISSFRQVLEDTKPHLTHMWSQSIYELARLTSHSKGNDNDKYICDRICEKGSSTHIQFTNFDNS